MVQSPEHHAHTHTYICVIQKRYELRASLISKSIPNEHISFIRTMNGRESSKDVFIKKNANLSNGIKKKIQD